MQPWRSRARRAPAGEHCGARDTAPGWVRNLVKDTGDVRHPYITPLHADSHADLPLAILVPNSFDPLRDVGHACAQKLAAAGNDLTYMHNPDLTHGFPQFTRSSAACHQATFDLADLIKAKTG